MSTQPHPLTIPAGNAVCVWVLLALLSGLGVAAFCQSTSEKNSEKYIIKASSIEGSSIQKNGPSTLMNVLARLDSKNVPGAPRIVAGWHPARPRSDDSKAQVPAAHVHDYTEILGYFGSDPNNPQNLSGEIELWLDGEKHVLTESSIIYIPKGMKHGPIRIRYLDKPVFHFAMNLSD
jgi:hypothetical protein